MRTGEAKGPFIFTPFSARREPALPEGPVQWVAGEQATVEVDISNPTTIPIKVPGFCYRNAGLEIEINTDKSS